MKTRLEKSTRIEIRILIAMLVCLFLCPLFADANEFKITADDGAAHDEFGISGSISGDYAIAGAHGDDDASGAAYIFHRVGATWSQQAKLIASDGGVYNWFGEAVAISGDYAIVGASGDDADTTDSGAAYIFHRSDSTWSQQAKLTANDGSAWDYFGETVALSGDYAIVGNRDDDNGTDSGAAYIFHRSGATWSQQAKLTASDGEAYERFGQTAAISGDYAIIGAVGDNDNGTYSGAAYIFHRSGATWSQQAKLTANDGGTYQRFGETVAISGDYAAVGAYGDNTNGTHSGSVYIFHRSGTIWSQQVKISAVDGAPYNYFGGSVGMNDNYIAVGAYGDDDNGDLSGSVYIFHRSGTTWWQYAKIKATDGAPYNYFGGSVGISGNYILVGADGDDDNGVLSGSAYFCTIHILGDVDGDNTITLADAIIALQVVTGYNPSGINLDADVNGDGQIGLPEAIYILEKLSGIR